MEAPRQEPRPSPTLNLFSRRLKLSAGTLRHERGEKIVAPMKRGLKIALLLQGQQTFRLDDRPPLTIAGPTLFVAANGGDHVQNRTFTSDEPLRYAIMQIDTDFAAEELGADFTELTDRFGGSEQGLGLWVRAAGPELRAIALQMAECRIEGAMRSLYLGGKALELAAMAVDGLIRDRPRRKGAPSARTIEQIHAARDLLVADLGAPPSLGELARATGLNVTKLTSGFRQVFGASVFGYLQEQRLQQAHELILSGRKSVAEAAFLVGYNPAHFSGIFRKRFGMSPSSLR